MATDKASLNYEKFEDEHRKGTTTHRLTIHINSSAIRHVLETASCFFWVMMVLWAELACIVLFVYIFLKCGMVGKLFSIVYATHMYRDRAAHQTGTRGQGVEFVRNAAWFRHFANYFPVSLVKTAELPAHKNYLFAVYPHGVISIGAFCNFATNATQFRDLFPGIRSRLCTLNYHFFIPFYRELVLAWGLISADRKSIVGQLMAPNFKKACCNADGFTSNAVCLIVGGAQEALNARPGNYRFVVKNRKGFVRIALETGASLVPVISFGETEILDQPSNAPGTKMRAYQSFVKKWTGVAPIFVYGQGFTEGSPGMLPYRRPITTVVGKPIDVEKVEKPNKEDIERLHERFTTEIRELFDSNKSKYLKNWSEIELVLE